MYPSDMHDHRLLLIILFHNIIFLFSVCKNATYFSETCNQPCPRSCKDHRCDINGRCFDCLFENTYGPVCQDVCSAGCKEYCDRDSGMCINGCQDGLYGDFCNIPCNNTECVGCHQNNGSLCSKCRLGLWGVNCTKECSHVCGGRYRTCHVDTAECDYCKPKFFGPYCTELCPGM